MTENNHPLGGEAPRAGESEANQNLDTVKYGSPVRATSRGTNHQLLASRNHTSRSSDASDPFPSDGSENNNNALEWAYRYNYAGFAVMAVHGVRSDRSCSCGDPHDGSRNPRLSEKDIGKHPVHGVTSATTDVEEIERWFLDHPEWNIAIATGGRSNLLVLDIDGEQGRESLASLEREHTVLPSTRTAVTGRPDGGEHRFFRYPEDQKVTQRQLGSGIDTRSDNGYVVVAPSLHRSGASYAWSNWSSEIAPTPDWVVERLEPSAVPDRAFGPQPDAIAEADLRDLRLPPRLQERLLTEAPKAGQRSEQQFAVVAALVDHGLDDDAIRACMQRHEPSLARGDVDRHTRLCLRKLRASEGDDDGLAPRTSPRSERFTELGNARRLVAANPDRFRWVPQWKTWLAWDGTRWVQDHSGEVNRAAKAVTAALWEEVTRTADDGLRVKMAQHAGRSEKAAAIEAMIRLARTEPGIPVTPDALDADPWLLNVTNGTIDLRTGELLPHRAQDLITKLVPIPYDPNAVAPTWTAFLERVLPDPEVRSFVARLAGYFATGVVGEQVLPIFWGGGGNGKSTFLTSLQTALGDYATTGPPDLLLATRNDPHPAGLASLQGRRMVIAAETEDGRRLNEAAVKRLTGGDRIAARQMYGDWFEFKPTHKLVMQTNHRPIVRGTDHAMWRRVLLVPFTETITDDEVITDLPERLTLEGDGVLAWIVSGCVAWQKEGLNPPAAVRGATADYRHDQDVLGAWMDQCVTIGAGEMASAQDLYDSYVAWCTANGEHPKSQRAFGSALAERGLDRRKHGRDRRYHWFGVGLADPEVNP